MSPALLADSRTSPVPPTDGACTTAPLATAGPGTETPSCATLLDRAYDEYCRLEDAGATPSAAEFCTAYPAIQSTLARLLSVHRAAKEDPQFLIRPDVRWPEAGQPFLGFQVERELGRGAFSRVFLAMEPALGDRRVVIKVSRVGASEALTLGRLEHPNIVPVYSVRQDDASGLAAVCMPYLGNATLCNLLDVVARGVPRTGAAVLQVARQPDPVEPTGNPRAEPGTYSEAINGLAIQLLDALSFIHGEGVCHRDLKPSNVLLTRDGVPMLLDFNLSADVYRGGGRFGGTPLYMSPEQLRALGAADADATALDARSDLFSLGVILYELLTGRHPFTPPPLDTPVAEMTRLLLQHQQSGSPPLRELNPLVHSRLACLVQRCLAFSPADRPAAAADARASLVRPPTRLGRWLRPAVNHPWLCVGILMLATAVSPLPGMAYRWANPPLTELQLAQDAEQNADYATAIEHLGRHLEKNTEDVPARLRRAKACLLLADHKNQTCLTIAYADLTEADRAQPDGRIKACVAYALQLQELFPSALFWYDAALKNGADCAELRNNLGVIQLELNDLANAEDSLNRAVQADPRLQAAFHNRGILRISQTKGLKDRSAKAKRLHQALEDLDRAVKIGPPTADLYRQLTDACAFLVPAEPTQADRAIAYLDQALRLGLDPAVLKQHPYSTHLKHHSAFASLAARAAIAPPEVKAHRVLPILPD